MKLRHAVAALTWAAALAVLIQCGSSSSSPTGSPTPSSIVVSNPTPTPTAAPAGGLPAGLSCNPTPPPILRMQVGILRTEGGRVVLDSTPLVENVDGYCDRVGFGNWKFCATRPEGHPERVACDYLVTGRAEDTNRWGPTWFFDADLCSLAPDQCANHPTEQFLAVAKSAGRFTACAAEGHPVAANGDRCGWMEYK